MTEQEAIDIGCAAMERDPRVAPYGILSGGSFALDTVRVFMWFETVEELADYLSNALPISFGEDEEVHAEFSVRAASLLAELVVPAKWDSIRCAYNELAKDFAVVDWLGIFDELLTGDSDLAVFLREDVNDDESSAPIVGEDIDGFIQYLRERG